MKICNTCKISKEFSEFNKDKTKKDGHSSACSICAKETARKWRENNRERDRENARRYGNVHKEEKYKYNKKWREKNKEKLASLSKERSKKYRENLSNEDKISEAKRIKDYLLQNPKYAEYHKYSKRDTTRRATSPFMSKETKNIIRKIFENCPDGYKVENIIPLKADGVNVCGLNVPENLIYVKI